MYIRRKKRMHKSGMHKMQYTKRINMAYGLIICYL